MCRKLSVMCLILALGIVSTGYAAEVDVIGSWEYQNDGWIHWGNGLPIDDPVNMPSQYEYSDVWSTDGDFCLKLTKTGWQQNLSIKLQDHGLVDEFMNHSVFSFDLMAPADTQGVGGWEEVYTMSLNAEGFGWNDLGDKPKIHIDFWEGSPQRVFTVSFDYSVAASTIAVPPNWVELIIATNGGDDVRNVFYVDNARLSGPGIPEPATLSLLGLGALALLRRKR